MSDMLPVILVALPFVSASALAMVGAWGIGTWINAGSAGLLFLLASLLPRHLNTGQPLLHVGAVEAHLVLLTAFVGMTTAWFSRGYTQAALVARSLDRRSARLHHVGCQTLIGAILLALLSDSPTLTWLALAIAIAAATAATGTIRTPSAAAAASRLLLLCGVGLMLALFGTLLLYLAVEPHAAVLRWSSFSALPHHRTILCLACSFLVIGYGALAGMAPLHSWLSGATEECAVPGVIIAGALMTNAPLLVFMRLRVAMGPDAGVPEVVLMVIGLATLLVGAGSLFGQSSTRRMIAHAGMAQLGIILFSIGIGSPVAMFAASLHLTLLTLLRASALQFEGLPPTKASAQTSVAGTLALTLLPLFALFLIVRTSADQSPWLLLPLIVGVLLVGLAVPVLLAPAPTAPRHSTWPDFVSLTPIWLQLALALMLMLAMPGPVVHWFTAVAATR